MGYGTGRLVPHPYLEGSTQTLNSHMVFTADVLSDCKQVTLYIPQVLSLDKTLVSETFIFFRYSKIIFCQRPAINKTD